MSKLYLNQLRKPKYDKDVVLDLLAKGDLAAYGRLYLDYTEDLPSAENTSAKGELTQVESIPQEHWQDWKYSKSRNELVDSDNYMLWLKIYVDQVKLDKTLNKTVTVKGAKPKYDAALFHQELSSFLVGYKLPSSISSHDGFCSVLYKHLPYLEGLGDNAPSLEWLKKKTSDVYKKLKSK